MDSTFLKETVGEVLASACAACCVAQPTDPVAYVGEWLLKHVQSDGLVKGYQKAVEVKMAKMAEVEEERKNRGPAFVPKFTHSPLNTIPESKTFTDVFGEAANEVVSLTGASACYFGVVADAEPTAEQEEEAWPLPEGTEAGAVPAFEEEKDLLGDAKDAGEPTEADKGDAEAEGSGDAEGDAAKGDEADAQGQDAEEGDGAEEGQGAVGYANSTIEYVAASTGSGDLKHMRLSNGEGITFESLLDSERLFLYEPNVMYRRGVKFLHGMPRVGAYMAVKLFDKSRNRCAAVLCADTLMPLGSGRTLNDEDRSTVSACARALQRALDGMAAPEPDEGAEALRSLTDELRSMTRLEFEEPTCTSEEMSVGMKRLDFARDQHTKISTAVQAAGPRCIDQLLASLTVPAHSFRVVKAVLSVLGKDVQALAPTWYTARGALGETLLDEIAAYDAANSSRSAEVKGVEDKVEEAARWVRVWRSIQGTKCKQLYKESVGGALLLKWVHSARAVAMIAAEVAEIEERMKAEEEQAQSKEADDAAEESEKEDAEPEAEA